MHRRKLIKPPEGQRMTSVRVRVGFVMPKLVKYWGGLFRLCTENLPDSIQNDKELHKKVLQMMAAKYANRDWSGTLPADRFSEMNNYVFSLLQEYF